MIQRSSILLMTLLLTSCASEQSVWTAAGPEAERIVRLAWTLFIGAALIMIAVIVALALSLRGPSPARAHLGHDRAVLVYGAIIPTVLLAILLGYGLLVMRASIMADRKPALRVEVTGEQWWWRINYISADGSGVASANELRIPVGQKVELALRSADVIHSFWAPALAGKLDMTPGRTTTLTLQADRAGIYRGQCAEYCGGAHALMAMEVVAMETQDYAAWWSAETTISEPATEEGKRGRALFLAAGCGACHAVRGTGAIGAVGPDLTRVGARRFIAAATLPTTRENVARFIRDPGHVKPSAEMPPFRFLSEREIDAVATYLVELK